MKTKIYLIIIIFFLFVPGIVMAQSGSVRDLYLHPPTDDFATIRQTMENYFKDRDQGRGSGYTQWKRWEYYNQTRLTPEGKVTNTAAMNWDAYNAYLQEFPGNTDSPGYTAYGNWICKGPYGYTNLDGWNPGVGRVNVISFHPSNSNIFWVGTPAGGLWQTINGGASWSPLTDGMPLLGVSGIAVSPANTNVMYILTGDGDAGNTKSIGVLKTYNGGVTWYSTGLTWTIGNDIRGYKLLMHPSNYSILFAATSDGIYKTSDAGATWTKVLAGYFYDMEFKPGSPTYVYASTGNQFFRSTNTGDNWTQITSGVPNNTWRIAIGVSSNNPLYVYLFTGPPTDTGYFTGVYRSYDSGGSFSLKSNSPNLLGYATNGQDYKHQTTYDLAVAVSNSNVADLIVGGINTWRSADYGSTWTITSKWDDWGGGQGIGYTHADIHDLAVNPLNGLLYCCSDGGVFVTSDFGNTWVDKTAGICHMQWYRIAGTESNANLIIGGTQDNGSNKWTGGTTIEHILGADGMDCMIDPTDANIMYYESQGGGLNKSTNGGTSHFGIAPANAPGPWITPLLMSPSNHLVLYAGYDTIRKSSNGGNSWSKIGVGTAKGNSALAMGTSNTNVIYAASGNNIYRSDNGGTGWSNVHSNLPALPITFIAVNPDNSSDVFVTVGNYNAGQKVYASSNGGVTWTNISGTLPNTVMNCIAYEDNNASPDDALYIGTDIGVFYRNANMTDWIPFQNGLPNVPVFDLDINKTGQVIRAGTFGRGLWSSELYTSCASNYLLSTGNDPSNPYYTGVQHYEASNYIESSRNVTGGIGTDVYYQAGNYVKLTTGFHVWENNQFQATLGTCGAAAPNKSIVLPVTGTFAGPMADHEE
jgi:hypothetical protein